MFSYRKIKEFVIKIECSNRQEIKNCDGKFVIILYHICYFFYDIKNFYNLKEINKSCKKYNQTEIDLSSNIPNQIFDYIFLLGRINPKFTDDFQIITSIYICNFFFFISLFFLRPILLIFFFLNISNSTNKKQTSSKSAYNA